MGSGGGSETVLLSKRAFHIEQASRAWPSPTGVKCGSGPHVSSPSPVRRDQWASQACVPYWCPEGVVQYGLSNDFRPRLPAAHLGLGYIVPSLAMSCCVHQLVVLFSV